MKLFEVRNAQGQFIGVWYAKNAKSAIARAEDELNAGAAFFRKTWVRVDLKGSTATQIERSDQ